MVLGKLMKLFNDENRMAALLRNVEVQDSSDVERIAAKLSVSTKTVRNDVKELNCLMGGKECGTDYERRLQRHGIFFETIRFECSLQLQHDHGRRRSSGDAGTLDENCGHASRQIQKSLQIGRRNIYERYCKICVRIYGII